MSVLAWRVCLQLTPPQPRGPLCIITSHSAISHCYPERRPSFMSHFFSFSLLSSHFSLWLSLIWGHVVFFPLTSPHCLILSVPYTQTHRNDNSDISYSERKRSVKKTFEEEALDLVVGCGSLVHTYWLTNITSSRCMFVPPDHCIQDFTHAQHAFFFFSNFTAGG